MSIDFSSALWSDITPQHLNEDQSGIAEVICNREYTVTMAYFRAMYALKEYSQRGLDLSTRVVFLAPSSYSGWHYRRLCLTATQSDWKAELLRTAQLCTRYPKNYQLWQHRKMCVIQLNDPLDELYATERTLAYDGKNYHAWGYRQWILTTFSYLVSQRWCQQQLQIYLDANPGHTIASLTRPIVDNTSNNDNNVSNTNNSDTKYDEYLLTSIDSPQLLQTIALATIPWWIFGILSLNEWYKIPLYLLPIWDDELHFCDMMLQCQTKGRHSIPEPHRSESDDDTIANLLGENNNDDSSSDEEYSNPNFDSDIRNNSAWAQRMFVLSFAFNTRNAPQIQLYRSELFTLFQTSSITTTTTSTTNTTPENSQQIITTIQTAEEIGTLLSNLYKNTLYLIARGEIANVLYALLTVHKNESAWNYFLGMLQLRYSLCEDVQSATHLKQLFPSNQSTQTPEQQQICQQSLETGVTQTAVPGNTFLTLQMKHYVCAPLAHALTHIMTTMFTIFHRDMTEASTYNRFFLSFLVEFWQLPYLSAEPSFSTAKSVQIGESVGEATQISQLKAKCHDSALAGYERIELVGLQHDQSTTTTTTTSTTSNDDQVSDETKITATTCLGLPPVLNLQHALQCTQWLTECDPIRASFWTSRAVRLETLLGPNQVPQTPVTTTTSE